MRIQGLIFDFDGTLVDTEERIFGAWQLVFRAFGGHLELSAYAPLIGTSEELVDLEALLERQIGSYDRQALRAAVGRAIQASLRGLSLRPGLMRYLSEAQERGLRLAIASSPSRAWVEGFLEQLGIRSFFSALAVRERVRRTKPDPELFLLALEDLRLQPEEAIAFKDSPHGVKAARSAGLFTVAFPGPLIQSGELSEAQFIIEDPTRVSLTQNLHLYRSSQVYAPGALEKSHWVPV